MQQYVLLTIEFVFLVSMLAVWWINRREANRFVDLQSNNLQHASKRSGASRRSSRTLHDAETEIPIPWGWPNCRNYRGRRDKLTTSESLYFLAEVLFKEKQLMSDTSINPRVTNSFRALIEDRHHPVDRNQSTQYSSEQEVPDDIWYIGPVSETRRVAGNKLKRVKQAIPELKTPWGW